MSEMLQSTHTMWGLTSLYILQLAALRVVGLLPLANNSPTSNDMTGATIAEMYGVLQYQSIRCKFPVFSYSWHPLISKLGIHNGYSLGYNYTQLGVTHCTVYLLILNTLLYTSKVLSPSLTLTYSIYPPTHTHTLTHSQPHTHSISP